MDRTTLLALATVPRNHDVWTIYACHVPTGLWRVLSPRFGGSSIPRHVSFRVNGSSVLYSLEREIISLDIVQDQWRVVGVGRYASCPPSREILSYVNDDGYVVMMSNGEQRVIPVQTVDGVRWCPDGSKAVAATPPNSRYLGLRLSDNVALVDIQTGTAVNIGEQRSVLGSRALAWLHVPTSSLIDVDRILQH